MARHSHKFRNNKFSNNTAAILTSSRSQSSLLTFSQDHTPAQMTAPDARSSSAFNHTTADRASRQHDDNNDASLTLNLPTPLNNLPTASAADQWPIPGLLPTGLCLLSSKAPTSSRALALHLALAIASNQPALDHFVPGAGQALYLSFHEHEHTFLARARHLLGEGELPHNLAFTTGTSSWSERCIDALTQSLHAFPHTRLVVIDSLSCLFPSKRFWSARRKQELLNLLNHLAHEYHLCILLLHSQARYSRHDPFDAIACPPPLLEAIEHCFILEHNRTQERATLHLSGPLMSTHQLKLRLSPDDDRWHLSDSEPNSALATERRAILDALHQSTHPLSSEELATTLKLDPLATRILLANMLRSGLLLLTPDQSYHPIPPNPYIK